MVIQMDLLKVKPSNLIHQLRKKAGKKERMCDKKDDHSVSLL